MDETTPVQGDSALHSSSSLFVADYTSKEEFVTQYKTIYGKDPKGDKNYLLLLTEFQQAILNGDAEKIRLFGSILNDVSNVDDEDETIEHSDAFETAFKLVHIAVREGYLSCVNKYLSNGFSIDARDKNGRTLLHYSSMNDDENALKYLIERNAALNAVDKCGLTPLHVAALFGQKNNVEILLRNGAIYNAVDKGNRKPSDLATSEDIAKLLSSTEKLFKAVRKNNAREVVNAIKQGAIVDARDAKGASLHYASWKGYAKIANILMENNADPNVVGISGLRPIHYAAKFSHLDIVKSLLVHDALHDAVADNGKAPVEMSTNKNIISLFNSIEAKVNNKRVDPIEMLKAKVAADLWAVLKNTPCLPKTW